MQLFSETVHQSQSQSKGYQREEPDGPGHYHFKGTDNASHDHDAEAKINFIEKIDETIGWLKENLDWENTHLAFASDHTTPIEYGDHVADPVPVLINGPNIRKDNVKKFDELSCARGGLNRFSGQLLPTLLSYSNMTNKFGA